MREDDALSAMMADLGRQARAAARNLAAASAEAKNKALRIAAGALRVRRAEILAANRQDVAEAEQRSLSGALLDRLLLNDQRIDAMAQGLEEIADLPDPIGQELARWSRPNGLDIARVRVPLGVIGIIYESRPNVTADAGALCLKSGNAALLRGGSESFRSSKGCAPPICRPRRCSSCRPPIAPPSASC
jgi:glutamate-5-semialdehyde dehydrogenase